MARETRGETEAPRLDPTAHPWAALDDAMLRGAWKENGRAARQAGLDLDDTPAGHASRPETARRLQDAREARAGITEEAQRRGIDLQSPRSKTAKRDRGAER